MMATNPSSNDPSGSPTPDEIVKRYSPLWLKLDGVEAVGVGEKRVIVHLSSRNEEQNQIPVRIGNIEIDKLDGEPFSKQ